MTELRAGPPLWRRIAQTLTAEIGAEGLPPGAKLPTEAQLASRFDVNRHTVRRAIEALVRSGLVRVEQGRGSFVAEDVLDYEVSARTRFSEWIRRQNKEPSGQVLHVRELTCKGPIAAGLGVQVGSKVALFERLGMADGVPVSLASHYFSVARLPGILEALQSTATITAALARVGVDDYLRQATRVSSRMPTASEAGLLRVSRARPLLVCENTNVDRAGTIVEFGIARYPSTRVQVVFEP
ncbi:MAG TPA: phosphonate metabolism transcriptional regulator PhnF [Acetobacteraceae bacterium]|nr:phosphonate metabolism transcriptional regulator PhnF [Acetobacteraceae bacterium]